MSQGILITAQVHLVTCRLQDACTCHWSLSPKILHPEIIKGSVCKLRYSTSTAFACLVYFLTDENNRQIGNPHKNPRVFPTKRVFLKARRTQIYTNLPIRTSPKRPGSAVDYTQPREVPEFCGDGTAGDARGGSPVNGKNRWKERGNFKEETKQGC